MVRRQSNLNWEIDMKYIVFLSALIIVMVNSMPEVSADAVGTTIFNGTTQMMDATMTNMVNERVLRKHLEDKKGHSQGSARVKPRQPVAETGTKVLIIAGEGYFRSSPSKEIWNKMMMDISASFSNGLKDELIARGQPAEVYINTNKDRRIREYLPKILAHKQHHALIQVAIFSETNGDLYLKPIFNPLELHADNTQDSYTVLEGTERKYQFLSAANPKAAMPTFSQLAGQFVRELNKNGHIKN